MKKMIIVIALTTMISSTLAHADPNAPQPSSDGRGINVPATASTGTALDRADSNQAQEDARMRQKDIKAERQYYEGETREDSKGKRSR